MLRQALQRALSRPAPVLYVPRACWQNHVTSDALAMLESQCETCCPVPRFPDQKVTVIGAASDVGRVACLLLKQQPVVKILAMYDEGPEKGLLGIATDIAHIDTNTAVHMYQGRTYLRHALHNADVVLICGGTHPIPTCCGVQDDELFTYNMQYVRNSCLAVAKFCPHALLALQTPPVDCNFTLCKHTLELTRSYDKRRLLGMNTINCMRATQLCSAMLKTDPAKSMVPVICGTGPLTRVPVFSTAKSYYCLSPTKLSNLTRLVREADELICKVKCDGGQGDLSIGFATARFVTSLMKGIFEKPTFIEGALVEQEDPAKCFGMEICSTPVTVGKGGIVIYHVPPSLTDYEYSLLDKSKCELADQLNLGRCYATGEQYPCKSVPRPPPCTPCPVCCQEESMAEYAAAEANKK